jgi:septal ring factor EnvC (AmiA/AmiB activator)
MDTGFIFSLISTAVSLGGLCVGLGVMMGKINHASEENKTQAEQLKTCASKEELSATIKRADEDRTRNSDQHERLFEQVNNHAKQIGEIGTELKSLKESVDELKHEIRSGIKAIQDDLKELQRQGQQWH